MGTVESPWPENSPINRRKAINELVRGREFTTQLQIILRNPLGGHGSVSAEDLLPKILTSFTEAIAALNTTVESGEVSQNPASTHVSSPSCGDRATEDSGESKKSTVLKDRRGSYKRRKLLQTWTKLSATPIDDGRAWRKYGQKVILNSKYPRNYYRCTHKNDQGCQATKQVQQTEDNPPMYRTTYIGDHTCIDMSKAPRFILDSTHNNAFVLSFEPEAPRKQDQPHPFFSCFSPSIKQECKEVEIPSDPTHKQCSSEYHLSHDEITFGSSCPTTVLPSTPGSDHGDVISGVYSGSTSSRSLDNYFVGMSDFDDVFHFEEDIFQVSM
uniref:WRKY70a n=1 Tax=Nelumbo nucifera TaxID=4432 RepID=A0A977LLH4_NELNU|nr:WRKY70a [Nelumbo nucifera]